MIRKQQFALCIFYYGVVALACFSLAAASATDVPRYVSNDPSGDLILKVEADKKDVYPDEQIILTYTLLTRYDTRYEGVNQAEGSDGFWFKDSSPEKNEILREVVRRGSKKYVQAVIRKRFFFPQKAGNTQIIPADLKMSYLPMPETKLLIFTKKQKERSNLLLTAPPIDIKVRDFPTAPSGFTGSLGRYSISSSIDKTGPSDGTYVFKITIEGEGNLWNVKLPHIDFGDDFAVLSVNKEVTDKGGWSEGVVTGNKVFRYELLPKRVGTLTLPAVPFVFFNLYKQDYETVTAKSSTIAAEISSKSVSKPQRFNSGLVILIDRSGSMLAEDWESVSRAALAKRIAREILTDTSMEWLSVVSFVGEVQQKSAQADKRVSLVEYLEQKVETDKLLEGTAMGDAIQVGVETFAKSVNKQGKKIMLLIGDGDSNSGHLNPKDAAIMAINEGAKIYSVAVGRGGLVPFPVNDPKLGKRYVQSEVAVNSKELAEVAQKTGGKFFRIEDPAQVDSVIQEIKRLIT